MSSPFQGARRLSGEGDNKLSTCINLSCCCSQRRLSLLSWEGQFNDSALAADSTLQSQKSFMYSFGFLELYCERAVSSCLRRARWRELGARGSAKAELVELWSPWRATGSEKGSLEKDSAIRSSVLLGERLPAPSTSTSGALNFAEQLATD